jgi:phage shock protein A
LLLILPCCLVAAACDPQPDQQAVRDAQRSCREAKDQAEYVAGLRKSLRQEPNLPQEIQDAVEEACAANDAIAKGRHDGAGDIAEAAVRAN